MIDVSSIEQIVDYFSFDIGHDDLKGSYSSLQRAIGKNLVRINDETNSLVFSLPGEGVRVSGKSGKFQDLEFKRATGRERRLLLNHGRKAGDAIFAIICRLCGIVDADLNSSPASAVTVMEDIVDLFLLSG